jgi:hypothetical protein
MNILRKGICGIFYNYKYRQHTAEGFNKFVAVVMVSFYIFAISLILTFTITGISAKAHLAVANFFWSDDSKGVLLFFVLLVHVVVWLLLPVKYFTEQVINKKTATKYAKWTIGVWMLLMIIAFTLIANSGMGKQ